MAHEHKAPGPCALCSIKHLGAAKVRIGEGLASSDPERMRARLLDATFELNEAESTHLGEYLGIAAKVRAFRKKVEETALGYSDGKPDVAELNDIIHELTEVVLEKAKKERASHPRTETPLDVQADQVMEAHGELEKMGGKVAVLEPITPAAVKEAIAKYQEVYKAPASISDIQFLLTIPEGSPLDKELDMTLAKAPPEKILGAIEVLEQEGTVKETPEGGYVDPPADKPFNILKPRSSSKMALTTSDVGYVVGSSFAAKGGEVLTSFADDQLGLSTQPPHARLSTWVPPIGGALLIIYSYLRAKKGRSSEATLAAAVAGSHLLSQTVDTAEQLATTGAAGFTVRRFQPQAAPVQTTPTGRQLF